jgi:hypothetical protein
MLFLISLSLTQLGRKNSIRIKKTIVLLENHKDIFRHSFFKVSSTFFLKLRHLKEIFSSSPHIT